MHDDFLKMFGLIIVVGYLIYLAVRALRLQSSIMEGLTNNTSDAGAETEALGQNKASGAQDYANEISKLHSKITDGLAIKDNRTAYENVIIQMDDLLSALMLQNIMSVNKSSITSDILLDLLDKVNKMGEGKKSLNSIMKFIDGF
jgi:hypothetical protein